MIDIFLFQNLNPPSEYKMKMDEEPDVYREIPGGTLSRLQREPRYISQTYVQSEPRYRNQITV